MNTSDTSSIFSDLRRFAGEIKAVKVSSLVDKPHANVPKKLESSAHMVADYTSIGGKVSYDLPPPVYKLTDAQIYGPVFTETLETPAIVLPAITAKEIAVLLKPPFIPLQDANGFICTDSMLAAKCQFGHIHKYYFTEIMAKSKIQGNLKCITCDSGNRFTTKCRLQAENLLGVPFILSDNVPVNLSSCYYNPLTGITVHCIKQSANGTTIEEGITKKAGTVIIFPTTSAIKIRKSISAQLIGYAKLSEVQAKAIEDINNIDNRSTCIQLNNEFPATLLPLSPELANLIAYDKNITTDPEIYLENC